MIYRKQWIISQKQKNNKSKNSEMDKYLEKIFSKTDQRLKENKNIYRNK